MPYWPTPSASSAAAPRRRTLDIAKGLGILLVVFGHNWIVLHESGALYRIVYSFHMPLFFFLSGVLLAPQRGPGEFALRRADSLLKPYAVVVAALGLVAMLQLRAFSPDYVLGAFYATGQSLLWTPLWFLPHLFVCQLAAHALLRRPWLQTRPRLVLLCALLLLAGVTLLRLGHAFQPGSLSLLPGTPRQLLGLPWSLDLLPLDTAFLLAGYLCARPAQHPGRRAWPLLCGAGLLFAALHWRYALTLDLNERRYDDLLLSTLAAGAGIGIVLALAALLEGVRGLAAPLAYVGRASLFVFIFHGALQGRCSGHFQALLPAHPYLGAWLGYGAGVLLPLLLYTLFQRVHWLGPLLLPRAQTINSDAFSAAPSASRRARHGGVPASRRGGVARGG